MRNVIISYLQLSLETQHSKELNTYLRIVTPLPLQSHKTQRLHYSKNQTIVG